MTTCFKQWRQWGPAVALALLVAWPEVAHAQRKGSEKAGLGRSIVTIEIARNQYDYTQPWSRRSRRLRKTGVVVGERQILTTADQVQDRTLVRLQKNGRGQWWVGDVTWVDYQANLAVVTTAEAAFWQGLKPAEFASGVSKDPAFQIVRWREGNLESRRAEFLQYTAREGMLSPVPHAVLDISSDIQGAGWGEPVVAGGKVHGLLMTQDGRTCTAIPAKFVRTIVEAHQQKAKEYRGLGFLHFYWMPAENPATLASLNLPGPPRGVIVNQVPERPDGGTNVLKANDVLLQIDGFDLDIQGDYEDPDYGHIMLEALATRGKFAGDNLKIRLWRGGKETEVLYQIPKHDYSDSLVPMATFDKEPEYIMIGGFVFQPLARPFLQSWGNEWKKRAPFRLGYYENLPATKEQPSLLFVSQVLPDPYNIGYQDVRYLVLDKVNGRRVSRLRDLVEALGKPANGFHVLEFMRSDSLQRVVLEAGPAEEQATARVLKRYGIPDAMRLNP